MSAARHMIALLKSHLEGDDKEFLSVAMQAAAHEARATAKLSRSQWILRCARLRVAPCWWPAAAAHPARAPANLASPCMPPRPPPSFAGIVALLPSMVTHQRQLSASARESGRGVRNSFEPSAICQAT